MLVSSPIVVATGTLHRLFEMKQVICLLILLIGVLNTHGTPIHIGIGAGGSLSGLENLPSSIVGGVEAIIGGGSSSTAVDESTKPPSIIGGGIGVAIGGGSSSTAADEPSVPAEESSSAAAETSEPSVPAEASESSSAAAESSEPSVPVEEPSSEAPVPAEPSTESPVQTETSPPPAPSSSSTESSAPSEVTVEVTSEPESSTNSTVPESTASGKPESTTEAWENPRTCVGSCPAVDSYDSVYLVNERCDKFCQCSNGRAIVLSCPDGLHFNRVLNVCDWPVNAKCARLAILN